MHGDEELEAEPANSHLKELINCGLSKLIQQEQVSPIMNGVASIMGTSFGKNLACESRTYPCLAGTCEVQL